MSPLAPLARMAALVAILGSMGLRIDNAAAQFGSGPSRFFGRSGFGPSTGPRADSKVVPVAVDLQKLKEGQTLFLRDWKVSGPLKSAAAGSDGLGPMFNEVSCVACHKSGAPGGAANAEKNVDLLTLEVTPEMLRNPNFEIRAKRVHPGFSAGQTTLILQAHKIASSERSLMLTFETTYQEWRAALLRKGTGKELSPSEPRATIAGLKVRLSQRNTPALFGAGLIDAVPDHILVAIADEQNEKYPDIKGRVPRDASGRVGRFGWRGQIDHLHEFVLGACANELGLNVPGHLQPASVDIEKSQSGKLYSSLGIVNSRGAPLDLTAEECLSITAFVGALMPPTRGSSASVTHARDITAGEKLFSEVGCAQCHLPSIGNIEGVYSDLLLHDMGADLGDPIGANPETGSFGSTGYYGAAVPPPIASTTPSPTNLQQEWRTPPLWGVGDSAPYLHDGRAQTLEDAIRLHAGQGRRSARQFAALPKSDRSRLLEFLASLASPRADGTAPGAVVITPPTTPLGIGFGGAPGTGGFFSTPAAE